MSNADGRESGNESIAPRRAAAPESLLRAEGGRSPQAQAERHLQLALQSAIDALHLLAEESARTPEDYGAAFRLLTGLDLVDEQLAERLARAAGLRNVLVRAYLDVDPQQVWDHLGRLDDFERFAAAVQGYVDGGSG